MKLGSRGSPLALAQSRQVAAMLAKQTGMDESQFPIESFMTSGDRIQGRLQEAGGKGLFTKELDEALLQGRIDAAIHSMKDLPTRMPEGIVLACVPAREDPRDAFIALRAQSLMELAKGATVGTASLRRQAQTLHLRPDLKVEMLRGRVETRLARIESGAFDATYLALAGLKRLGLENHAASLVDSQQMPPAPGQGALAITARANDEKTLALLSPLNLVEHAVTTTAERAFLEALDGSCRTPIAATAGISGDQLSFLGEVLTPDGRHCWRRRAIVALGSDGLATARALGLRLGTEIRCEAGPLYQAHFGDNGW
ncbi:MAG TPA: hydroxymethylbilane synthase [Rhizomicrobium sp.]|jgi:hydroxymethylbilane synthase|nr:hydroxymethylbilane synthase [Rhizomicrobium sp.]